MVICLCVLYKKGGYILLDKSGFRVILSYEFVSENENLYAVFVIKESLLILVRSSLLIMPNATAKLYVFGGLALIFGLIAGGCYFCGFYDLKKNINFCSRL